MSNVAVVYWSGTGNTEAMAEEIAAGAERAGAHAELVQASDFEPTSVAQFDAFALGCPAMGVEELEESEFGPMYDAVEPKLDGKKVVLFGSYGWGTGEWMEAWEDRARNAGVNVVTTVIANEEPDESALAECDAAGASLA